MIYASFCGSVSAMEVCAGGFIFTDVWIFFFFFFFFFFF